VFDVYLKYVMSHARDPQSKALDAVVTDALHSSRAILFHKKWKEPRKNCAKLRKRNVVVVGPDHGCLSKLLGRRPP
jgi:hypothetical protein